MTSALSELLFVFLPFIVIAITLAHQGELGSILSIPEWSIVTAVITGQAIVKFASFGIGRTAVHRAGYRIDLINTARVSLSPDPRDPRDCLDLVEDIHNSEGHTGSFLRLRGIIAFFVACRLDYYAREA